MPKLCGSGINVRVQFYQYQLKDFAFDNLKSAIAFANTLQDGTFMFGTKMSQMKFLKQTHPPVFVSVTARSSNVSVPGNQECPSPDFSRVATRNVGPGPDAYTNVPTSSWNVTHGGKSIPIGPKGTHGFGYSCG